MKRIAETLSVCILGTLAIMTAGCGDPASPAPPMTAVDAGEDSQVAMDAEPRTDATPPSVDAAVDAVPLDADPDSAPSPSLDATVDAQPDASRDATVPAPADAAVPLDATRPSLDMALDVAPLPEPDADVSPRIVGDPIELSPLGGTYPRVLQRADGRLFGTFDSGDAMNFVLRTVAADRVEGPWVARGIVAVEPIEPGRTLGNAYPFEWTPERTLCAFRHHNQVGDLYVHRLLLSASDDGGDTWRFVSEIEVDDRDHGLWEPLLFRGADGHLQVYYAWEHTVGGKQDIVMRRSRDGGMTWSDRITVASNAQSRDGMPGVARLNDGTLVTVFESFRQDDRGPFVIRATTSTDDGATWGNRQAVYVPEAADRHAGAPALVTLADGRLLVSFMTDEEGPGGDWPNGAAAKVLISDGIPTRDALVWRPHPLTVADAPAFWPSLTALANGDALVLYDQAGPKARRLTFTP